MASSSSSSSPEIPYAHAVSTTDQSFFSYASLDEVLEELSTRFIMNLPDQELESAERMCFQVEQAHWYYEDFMREANPKLPSLPLRRFSSMFFNSCPLLRQWSSEHEQFFDTFMQYKVRVPVCGAIMLNDKWDKCILVKGWKSSAGWSFPRGKINQNEPAPECAAREVAEETGFNISSWIKPEDYIEMTIREQRVTLFIVGGIPEDYSFQTRTRKEISKIEWFKLSDLPAWKRNKQVPGKFYLISAFMPALKEFIKSNKTTKRRQNRRKGGVNAGIDLAIKTDFEENSIKDGEGRRDPLLTAVSLDRDVHGYSSSSVDNGEPQTPSPQSTEALPVMTEADLDGGSEHPLDPHFARLLNGLTLSASKLTLIEESEQRPTSVTPTAAKNNLTPSAKGKDVCNVKPLSPSVPGRSRVMLGRTQTSSQPPLLIPVNSPSDSSRSDGTIVAAGSGELGDVRLSLSELSPSVPPIGRTLKHLALLESVAQESAITTSASTARQLTHPGPPSSVPPLPTDPENRWPHGAGRLASSTGQGQTLFNSVNRPVHQPMDDPFTVRPMTSQAVFPPSLSARRHGSNMNPHQGSLLSILSSSGSSSFRPALGNMTGRTHVALNGSVQPLSQVSSVRPQTMVPQTLRVAPPPAGAFQFQSGPLSAPLSTPSQPKLPFHPQGRPPVRSPGFNGASTGYVSQTMNTAHLLSLLNSNNIARPTTLLADAARPSFPAGGTATPL